MSKENGDYREEYTQEPQAPPVWPWYVAYCAAMAIMYLLVAALGIVLLVLPPELLKDQDSMAIKIQAIVCLVLGLPFFLIFALAPFLPRKSWAWIYGMVVICISFGSCCCLPAGIPLLIQWIKPETQKFFGR